MDKVEEKISIYIADDHEMFIEGISLLLAINGMIVVEASANTGTELIELLEKKKVDVVLLDINMPEMNGFEAAKVIVKKFPSVKIIALSMFLEKEYIQELIDIGVSGYILKNTKIVELEKAIILVASGKKCFSNDVGLKLLNAQTNNEYPEVLLPDQQHGLTEREIDVLKLIVQENTTSEIAEKLFISIHTVETHRKNLIKKVKVKNIAGLVKYAVQNGIAV
ncbi:MAG: response regulator transcription factor [Bacteroidetes bacterium]|nr:response regulator transcription factor [Bacteroidota bacterium]